MSSSLLHGQPQGLCSRVCPSFSSGHLFREALPPDQAGPPDTPLRAPRRPPVAACCCWSPALGATPSGISVNGSSLPPGGRAWACGVPGSGAAPTPGRLAPSSPSSPPRSRGGVGGRTQNPVPILLLDTPTRTGMRPRLLSEFSVFKGWQLIPYLKCIEDTACSRQL